MSEPKETRITTDDIHSLIESVSHENRQPHDPNKPVAMTCRNGVFYDIYVIDGKIVERVSEQQY